MADAIVVDALTRRFGTFVAVDRLSFTVGTGEIFGFLGPNGAGKTTAIKMLTGLLAPSAGAASVAGLDVRTHRHALKHRIGYMSQLFSLYGDLTVEENIRLFAGLYGVTGARFVARRDWVLGMARLQDERRRLTAELPLGWKQRLALGCAVLHEPAVLFLDEPTSGVDPLSRRRFWDLIYELAGGGTTVLISTHYMEEAEYAQRLALMHRGRLVALDTARALKRALAHPVLSIETDNPSRVVETLREAPGVLEAAMFGRAVHVMIEHEARDAPAVRERLRAAGHVVRALNRVPPSLEDVFVALVRGDGGALES